MRAVSLTAGLLARLQRSRRTALAFSDPAEARAWAEALPQGQPAEANRALASAIEAFAAESIGSSTQLDVLEVLRPLVHVVQADLARRYRGFPAPLRRDQVEAVEDILNLWKCLAAAYLQCARDGQSRTRTREPDKIRATALQRALDATSRLIAEYYYAYRLPPAWVYESLNDMYRTGERLDLLKVPVVDPFQKRRDTRCRDAWTRALLLDGCLPREHHHRELGIIFRLLEQWATRVRVIATTDASTESTPPLFIDLSTACGLRPTAGIGEGVRVLDVSALASELRQLLTLVRQGAEVPGVALGSDMSRREFENVVLSLYRQWCEGGIRRMNERQPSEAMAHVSSGLLAAHFYLGRRPFEQPFGPGTLPARGAQSKGAHSIERIRVATDYLQAQGIRAEQWRIRDESVSGLGLTRPHQEAGDPWINLGLLISVRPRGLNTTLVGTIRWMQEDARKDLQVGVRLVPGIPVAIAARVPDAVEFEPAILMLPLPAANAPSSLVVAPGRVSPRMVIEIYREGIDRIEITALLESGGQFERFAFMPAGSVYDPGEELEPST